MPPLQAQSLNSSRRFFLARLFFALIIFLMSLAATTNARAGERVLHSFVGGRDGNNPTAPVILVNGNMYGTTSSGGRYCAGTVYEMKRTNRGWKETMLYHFTGGSDGYHPYGGLVADESGNLYGTTMLGGAHDRGTIFELSRGSDGKWNESVLYNFCSLPRCDDGEGPYSGLTWDNAGNLYGTTSETVFQLSPSASGWTLTTIYTFNGNGVYGADSPLLVDASGNLYGNASYGGNCDWCGAVFELSPSGASWSYATLYNFNDGADGGVPRGQLLMDKNSNIYGTTAFVGSTQCLDAGIGCGVVFELSPAGGTWVETVLYTFTADGDGTYPTSVVFAPGGSLYGTTNLGGTGHCQNTGCGTIFKLTQSGGTWKESVRFSFRGANGYQPQSGALTTDSHGRLYGTTVLGGKINHGTLYEFKP